MGAWNYGIFDDDTAYDFVDEIKENAKAFFKNSNEKYTLTNRARVSTAISMLDLDFLDFVEKPDTNAYVIEIKKCDAPCKSIKFRQSHPLVESFIKHRDKQKSQQNFSIIISNYFCWGNVLITIVVPQTVKTDGNKKKCKYFSFSE
jgi:hypothetical protein